MSRQKLIHIHSVATNTEGTEPKLPTADQIEYGEIAVNYHKGYETVSLKNDNNEIITLPSQRDLSDIKEEIVNNEKVVATTLNTLNSSAGFGENGKYAAPTSNIILSNASSLENADKKLASAFRYGCTNVTTLTNLPITTRLVYASLSANSSLTIDTSTYSNIFTSFPDGIEMKVIAFNSSNNDITITLPYDDYKCFVTTLTVKSGEYGIITIDFKSQTEVYINGKVEHAIGYTGNYGIVAFSDGTNYQFIKDKESNLADFKTAYPDYEPIGIVVIPSSCSNIIYPQNDVRRGKNIIMSLKAMSCSTPDTGGTENISIGWGGHGVDTDLNNFAYVNYYSDGVSYQSTVSTSSSGYLPSDAFGKTASKVYPSLRYYNDAYSPIPSPFKLVDGELIPNEEYYTTAYSNSNVLSDFAGPKNTYTLTNLAKQQTDWSSKNVEIVKEYTSGYYPAVCSCARFGAPDNSTAPKGTMSFLYKVYYDASRGILDDFSGGVTKVWYMPACGELGFIVPHRSKNDSSISNINTVYGDSTAVPLSNNVFWSSSENNLTLAFGVALESGLVNRINKSSSQLLAVRAFCAI